MKSSRRRHGERSAALRSDWASRDLTVQEVGGLDPARDIAYMCGNPNMVDACVEAMKGFGLPMKHIRREKYVSLK